MNRFRSGFSPGKGRQQGLSTVLVSIILLLAATIVVFFTARSAVVEQRISGNELRSKQALAAAEAGLGFAEREVRTGLVDANNDDLADLIMTQGDAVATLSDGSQFRVWLCDHADPEFNLPGAGGVMCGQSATDEPATGPVCKPPSVLARHAVTVSCGWSDDESARHIVTQLVRSSPSLPGPPSNPITAKGAVDVGGNMTVVNYYNNLSVWTGQSLDYGNATSKTFIRDPSLPVPEPPDFDNPETLADYDEVPEDTNFANCGGSAYYICGTHKDARGPDVIESDGSLRNISDDDLFRNYFGLDPEVYKEDVATTTLPAGSVGGDLSGEIVWVEGNANFDTNEVIGTREDPVIMIVDGNASFSGNTEINGVVYVRDNVQDSGGTPKVYGAMVAEGDVDGTGNITVLYDPMTVGRASELGEAASVPGTWRDWPEE